MFSDKFEAWIHGPTIPSLYRNLKKFGRNPVKSQNPDFSPLKLAKTDILDEVWRIYDKYDAIYLEILTHQEAPWIDARQILEFEPSSKNEIPIESMKQYYGQKMQDAILPIKD